MKSSFLSFFQLEFLLILCSDIITASPWRRKRRPSHRDSMSAVSKKSLEWANFENRKKLCEKIKNWPRSNYRPSDRTLSVPSIVPLTIATRKMGTDRRVQIDRKNRKLCRKMGQNQCKIRQNKYAANSSIIHASVDQEVFHIDGSKTLFPSMPRFCTLQLIWLEAVQN